MHVLVGRLISVAALVLIIDLDYLAVKQACEQAGCVPKLLWLTRLDSVH